MGNQLRRRKWTNVPLKSDRDQDRKEIDLPFFSGKNPLQDEGSFKRKEWKLIDIHRWFVNISSGKVMTIINDSYLQVIPHLFQQIVVNSMILNID